MEIKSLIWTRNLNEIWSFVRLNEIKKEIANVKQWPINVQLCFKN